MKKALARIVEFFSSKSQSSDGDPSLANIDVEAEALLISLKESTLSANMRRKVMSQHLENVG